MTRAGVMVAVLLLGGCAALPPEPAPGGAPVGLLQPDAIPPPVIRQPVLPEMLVACRGHVLVPALGMIFVPKGGTPPETGQFVREERVAAPYRVIMPGARVTQDMNAARLNIELDRYQRVIGLFCG
jgi:hypothetical protein